jgi:hypothetical protein
LLLSGNAYMAWGTSAITLWSISWEPLRWDIEKLSANEVINSVSGGACTLEESWGEVSLTEGTPCHSYSRSQDDSLKSQIHFSGSLFPFLPRTPHPLMSPISYSPGIGQVLSSLPANAMLISASQVLVFL